MEKMSESCLQLTCSLCLHLLKCFLSASFLQFDKFKTMIMVGLSSIFYYFWQFRLRKFKYYSSVPNRRAVRNKRAGGKILKKILNVQDRIDVQGEFFLENQYTCRGENFWKINNRGLNLFFYYCICIYLFQALKKH